MNILEEIFEEFEIITQKGEAYGTLKGKIVDKQYFAPYFATTNQTLNQYDILRQVSKGRTIRLISEPKMTKAPKGDFVLVTGFFQDYKMFKEE